MSTPAAFRTASAMSLIHTTIDPRRSNTNPPNLWNVPSVNQTLEFEGRFKINNDTTSFVAGGEQIPTQKGMLLWLMNRGAASVARMGFIPDGKTVTAGAAIAGHRILPVATVFGNMQQRPATITFNAPLAVPYSNDINGDQLNFSPDLGNDFSTARLNSGVMEIDSTTLPNGATNLNGVFAVAAINDTRDISQKRPADDKPFQAFSVTDMITSCISQQDAIKGVAVADGIATVIGPEFPPTFTNPNADGSDSLDGSFFSYGASQGLQWTPSTAAPVTPAPFFKGIFAAWISPWQTTATAAALTYPNVQRIITDQIGEMGVLDFDFVYRYGFNPNGGAEGGFFRVSTTVVHHFATCRSDGALDWYTHTDTQGEMIFALSGTYYDTNEFDRVHKARPKLGTTGFTTSGKYIGSYVTLNLSFVDNSAGGGVALNNLMAFDLSHVSFRIRAPEINKRGECGPARIIRWDGLATDMWLDLAGMANAQCIAQSKSAHLIRSAQFNTANDVIDVNVIPLVAALYNNQQTPLKRDWTKVEYRAMIQTLFQHLSPETIQEWAARSPELAAGAQAAGFFDTIGSYFNKGVNFVNRGLHTVGHIAEGVARGAETAAMLAAAGAAAMAGGQFQGASAGLLQDLPGSPYNPHGLTYSAGQFADLGTSSGRRLRLQ